MALRGNNFVQQIKFGSGIPAQSVSTVAVTNGNTISEPWRDGRQLAFIWNGGAFAATASGRLKVQGRLRGTSTWEDVQRPNSGGDLEFPVAKFDDAGAAENGCLIGTVDLSDIDGVTYDALRPIFDNEVAVAMLISVAYIIFDLYERPSGSTDELFALQREIDTP